MRCGWSAVAMAAALAATLASTAEAQLDDTNVLLRYGFAQDECAAGVFADNESPSLFGDLSRGASPPSTECPQVTSGSFTYDNAFRGMRTAAATVDTDEGASSASASALSLTTSTTATLEFFVRPSVDITTDPTPIQYALLEIGDAAATGDVCGTDYSLRIIVLERIAGGSEVQVSGTTSTGCTVGSAGAAAFSMDSGKTYHIVVGLLVGVLSLHISEVGSSPTADGVFSTGGFDLAFIDPTHTLHIGAFPPLHAAGVLAFPGDIMMAAIYDGRLFTGGALNNVLTAQLQTNNAAGPGNSLPVAPNVDVEFSGAEDEFASVDLSSVFFDFDGDAMTFTLGTLTPGGKFGGSFQDSVGPTSLVSGETLAGDDLEFQNSVANEYSLSAADFGAEFTVSAEDGDGLGVSNATFGVILEPRNDAPETVAQVGTVTAAQLTTTLVPFLGSDPDCQSGDSTESCDNFGDTKTFTVTNPLFGLASETVGRLFECSSVGNPPVADTGAEVPASGATFTVDGTGTVTLNLCLVGCGGVGVDCPVATVNDPIIGTVDFTYTVNDGDNDVASSEVSPVATVSAEVANALSAEAGAVLDVPEDNVTEITLGFVDRVCDGGFASAADCDDLGGARRPIFVMMELPDASQGVLYYDDNFTFPIGVGEDIDDTAQIFLAPAEDYFTTDSFPLCGTNAGSTFSRCPQTDDNGLVPCTGSQCAGQVLTTPFTFLGTTDLQGNLMGDGDPALCLAGSCGIQLNYTVTVDGTTSLPAVGTVVNVVNSHDDVVVLLPPTIANQKKNSNVLIRNFGTIALADPDGDNRVMEVTVASEGVSATVLFGTLDEGVDFAAEQLSFGTDDALKNNGATEISFRGTVSEVNKALQFLMFRTTASTVQDRLFLTVKKLRSTSADFTGNEVLPTAKGSPEVFQTVEAVLLINFDIDDDEGGVLFNLSTVAIYGVIGGSSLCCLACICGCALTIGHRAVRGERAAVWVLENVLCSKLDAEAREKRLEQDMASHAHAIEHQVHHDHSSLERIQWCAHVCACLCPCIVKFESKKDMIPSEESILIKVNDSLKDQVAQHHLPKTPREKSVRLKVSDEDIFNWEMHMFRDETTQREIPFYYNVVTQESSWLKPSVDK